MAANHFDPLSREHLLFLIIGALAVLALALAYRVYFIPSETGEIHMVGISSNILIESAWTPT
jgi:hypothetical protein